MNETHPILSYDKKTLIRVLVASPSDVTEERKIVREEIENWNIRHAHSGIRLEALLWETSAAPHSSGDRRGPQEPINRQLVDVAQCAIGMFWTRIGTPTKEHPGGAVEEVQIYDKENWKGDASGWRTGKPSLHTTILLKDGLCRSEKKLLFEKQPFSVINEVN